MIVIFLACHILEAYNNSLFIPYQYLLIAGLAFAKLGERKAASQV